MKTDGKENKALILDGMQLGEKERENWNRLFHFLKTTNWICAFLQVILPPAQLFYLQSKHPNVL